MDKIKMALQSSAVRGSQKLMVFLTITVVLFIITIFVGSKAVLSYQKAEIVKAETAEMKATIINWQNKVDYISKETFRPVGAEQVDNVNSDILIAINVHNLTLEDFKANKASGKAEESYQVFQIKVGGQYADVVKFLLEFHAKDALVSIMNFSMSSSQGIIHADITYRIYTK